MLGVGYEQFWENGIKEIGSNALGIVYEIKPEKEGYTLYGWHITSPKLFDKPRELGEFGIARAPMSWCYVEELQ